MCMVRTNNLVTVETILDNMYTAVETSVPHTKTSAMETIGPHTKTAAMETKGQPPTKTSAEI